VAGALTGFDSTHKIASAKSAATVLLAPGAEAALDLALAKDEDNVTPETTTLDLGTSAANLTVKGAQANGRLGSAAVCDVDHDGKNDLVIGVPAAVSDTADPTGAVYVVFGGGSATVVDLASAPPSQVFHFYGQNGGDELGAALACADVTSDGIPDLIVGAPGAFGAAGEQQAGRVYVIAGRASLASTTIKVGMGGAEVEWVGPAANAGLGQTLLARDLDNDGVAE